MPSHNAYNPILCVVVTLLVVVALSLSQPVTAQKTAGTGGSSSSDCHGLHAGIRAQIIPENAINTPSVMLSFFLLNDSETAVDVEASSWKIVVNGEELSNSGVLLGNGPEPEGGYRMLRPGETYEFGVALPIAQYFLANGSNKVSWKGAAFQSPTIVFTVARASH
ncbi:MAG: hypothetical protein WBV55_17020 [Candidatus Sulfotelmatobacter sp.]